MPAVGQALLQVGSYRFDLFGEGWFGKNDTDAHRSETAALWKTIGDARDALASVNPLEGPLPLPEIAVFIDERAPLTQPIDGTSWGAWSIDGVLSELGKVGAPRRHYYTDDLPTIDPTSVKLSIFPNAFAPSQAVRDALKAWQNNPAINTTFLFTGPAGLVETDARDASKNCTTRTASVGEFTGIPGVHISASSTNNTRTVIKSAFLPEEEAAFPGISDLASMAYGDTKPYSPVVAVGARTAGGASNSNNSTATAAFSTYQLGFIGNQGGEASLVASALNGGGWSILSAAHHMPAALYLCFAKAAGVHLYSDGNTTDVVASGNGIYVHAVGPTEASTRSGTRTVSLPSAMLVTGENGQKLCSTACTSFKVVLLAGQSTLFTVK